MLSICIPVYNYQVVVLVTQLLEQAHQLEVDFEILVWEDGSSEENKQENRKLSGIDDCVQYVEWEENRGRSIIRNRLAEAARYRYLLFLDCDALVPDNQFLARYYDSMDERVGQQVVCGGRVYPPKPTEPELQLHWLYGSIKESQDVERRSLSPNASFMTNNFLISRSIFEIISFNEELVGYGHEDTLFGWELQKRQIEIKHIDNPVIHEGLESAASFLQKTEEGIRNLYHLHQRMINETGWHKEIKLLRLFHRLKQWRIAAITFRLLTVIQPFVSRQVRSGQPSLVLFDLYKLYYLLERDRKE